MIEFFCIENEKGLKSLTEAVDFMIVLHKMVAEHSVNLRRFMVTYFGKIRRENVGMSSYKQCIAFANIIVTLSSRFPRQGFTVLA